MRPRSHAITTAALATCIALGAGWAGAEKPVARTGVFTELGATPDCDDIWTGLEQAGRYILEHGQKLGEGFVHALEGDPSDLINQIDDEFKAVGNAAANLSKYTPLALAGVIADALPPGKVTDFLKKGVKLQSQLRAETGRKLGEGLNPIGSFESKFKDGKEFGTDFYNHLKNVNDPESLASEWWKMQQKWSGAGALTYVFTEKDPAAGLQKALQAMHHQVKVASDMGAGPEGRVASAVFGVVMDETKSYIDKIKDPEQKKAAGALAAAFAVAHHRAQKDPELRASLERSRHPIYSAEQRWVDVKWLGDDYKSGGDYDWGLVHPVVEDKPGCISLGDMAYAGHSAPRRLLAICGVEEARDKWWSRPIDFERVWGDNCSHARHDRSIWVPVCKEGFWPVGFAGSRESSNQKPLPNAIACLKQDPTLMTVVDGIWAGLEWRASDTGSGAKYDVTLYQRSFLGIPLMYAAPKEKARADRAFVQAQQVAVPVPGVAPGPAEAYCVNFYAEAGFRGRTYQICDQKADRWALNGEYGQVSRDVSSFQCGDAFAGVRLFQQSSESPADQRIVDCREGAELGGYDNLALEAQLLPQYNDPISGVTVWSPRAQRAQVLRKLQRQAELREIDKERLERCQENENGEQCYKLAQSYTTGTEVLPEDLDRATKLFQKACDWGDKRGCETLRERGIASCKAGIGVECTRLGRFAEFGNYVVEKNLQEARSYYSKGCSNHDGDGCYKLGEMLRLGEGGEENLGGALTLFRVACDYGKGYGCFTAGYAYRGGLGTRKDLHQARLYFQRGCEEGVQESCNAL